MEEVMKKMEELMKPLTAQIRSVEIQLHVVKLELEQKIATRSSQIRNLQTRIMSLEEQSSFTHHLMQLNLRRLDDLEQYSRKVNLMFYDIPKFGNDNPTKIMDFIKSEINKLKC